MGRQAPKRGISRGEIIDQLLCRRRSDSEVVDEPMHRRFSGRIPVEVRGYIRAEARHRFGQLVAASWRFAKPERNRGRHAMRILDAHDTTLDPPNSVTLVAKLEDIAR